MCRVVKGNKGAGQPMLSGSCRLVSSSNSTPCVPVANSTFVDYRMLELHFIHPKAQTDIYVRYHGVKVINKPAV